MRELISMFRTLLSLVDVISRVLRIALDWIKVSFVSSAIII